MRSIAALLASTTLVVSARAHSPLHHDDAALHAVQFVDRQEGWAAGDDGVIWHTIDGGQTWERQPTGVTASLRSVHFLNPYTGWVVGREELPHGGGSVGVLLFTQDGGLKWRRAGLNTLPGLNVIRFLDNKTGFVAGDGTEQFPTGVFTTSDGGRTWKPLPGSGGPAWLSADFQDARTGILAGAWSRLATLRQGTIAAADVDLNSGRSIRGVQQIKNRAVAVGAGGLVLTSDTHGQKWGYPEGLSLPPEVRAAWDFHAVHCLGEHIWAAGRPGSKILHSPDAGRTWDTFSTGQPLPLNALYFIDEAHGWAVGEFGSVMHTADGGKTWRVQRRGGQRSAVLFIHARPNGLPVDTVALLGAQEGYLTVGLRVTTLDPASTAFSRSSDGTRLAAAVRRAGGAAGEMLWQFPVAQHRARVDKRDLLQSWDRWHGDRAAEQLLRQLVLALRMWRPSVVITDDPDEKASGLPIDSLVAAAVHEAFDRAADPTVFPEQLQALGLEPWQVSKLYGRWHSRTGAHVVLDLNEPSPRLGATPRDFASGPAGLLADFALALPAERCFRLLANKLEGQADQAGLMDGIALAPQGVARRELKPLAQDEAEVLKTIRARRNLQVLAEAPASNLVDSGKLLAQIGPALKKLPDDQGAAAAFAVANQYARLGQWSFAREVFLLMVDRYPAHPLSAEAYRWLIRHNSSSEARRRHELGHFLAVEETSFRETNKEKMLTRPMDKKAGFALKGGLEEVQGHWFSQLSDKAESRRWYEGCLEVGDRLAALGPLFATDPSIQFCLQSARRNLGDFETARAWYARFSSTQPAGPWRDAALAELWLTDRSGPPPKPVAVCRQTATRPFLDGNFEDPCWQGLKPLIFANAVGDTAKDYPTRAWLAYDQEYLYLALRCRHPEGHHVAPVKVRPHDADLRPYDRVSLILDLDRDYSTYYHFQVDQRGCVCDDCWGDRSWNPRWFVAVHSDQASWQIEAAIPLAELSGDHVTLGKAWAFNIVRVVPGRGVQAWSLPADVQPRPEGMGLLIFTQAPTDNHTPKQESPTDKVMKPATSK
jgi:photosystem II stability/assembly factor-like uncharacterized protein